MQNSLQLNENSVYADCDEVFIDKKEGGTRRISDSEESSCDLNYDWNKMCPRDSEESCEESKSYDSNSQDYNSTLSLDAFSIRGQSNHMQHAFHLGDQMQAANVSFKPCGQTRDNRYVFKQIANSNGQKTLDRESFFDAVIVYAKEDINEVTHFVQYVNAVVHYHCGFVPEVELYDQGMFCSSTVSVVDDVLNRSSVVFVYLTRNINSSHLQFFIDEAVSVSRLGMNSSYVMAGRRTTDRQWALKPVHTLPKHMRDYRTPAGLVSCRGIDWFYKDSEHTRNTVVSVMKEARRIRTEAERWEIGSTFQDRFSQPPNVIQPSFVQDQKTFTSRGVPAPGQPLAASQDPVEAKVANSGHVTVRFRPSARPQQPPVSYHSPGPPVYPPPYHVPSRQNYGLPKDSHQRNTNMRMQNLQAAQRTERFMDSVNNSQSAMSSPIFHNRSAPVYQRHAQVTSRGLQHVANLDIDNRQSFENAPSNQSHRHEGLTDRRQPRRYRKGQNYRNRFPSSESETSSSDEDDDFEESLPSELKKKRNINIIGCKFVQLGKNNRVLDSPTVSKKKDKIRRRVKDEESGGDASVRPDSKTVSKHDQEIKEKQDSSPKTLSEPAPHQVFTAGRSSQTLNSSVVEDNLDVSNAAIASVSRTSETHKEKDLRPLDVIESPKASNIIRNMESDCAISNVEIRSAGELKEYQLTTTGKQKNVFVNDLDTAGDDDEGVHNIRAHENIRLESSDDNNALSEDQDVSEAENLKTSLHKGQSARKGITEKNPANSQTNISTLQSTLSHPRSIDFMAILKTLKIIPTTQTDVCPGSGMSGDDVE